MERVQLIRFTKALKPGDVWINPMAIVYAEVNEKKDDDVPKTNDKDKNRPPKTYTVLHLLGSNDKVFINEHPDEINGIIRRLVIEKETKQATSYR
jgi:hypothetical protein